MEPLQSRRTHCPRCQRAFECKANDIQNCDCNAVTLDDRERQWISEQYEDCLCSSCMTQMKDLFLRTPVLKSE